MRKLTNARGFGGNFQLSIFFGEKATVFFVLVLSAPFLGTTSAMAKTADDIARPLNVSDLDNSALADAIGDYFEDCSLRDAEGVALLARASWKQGYSKQSVITSMLINSR